MEFALVNGQRQEAQRNLSGECQLCGERTIAKCGDERIHHWAHKSNRRCDQWWENETEWHRNWKNQFPREWREVPQHAADGEKHIADVKTGNGFVLEFQHSYLPPEERGLRDAFYPKLVWVVDGTGKRHKAQLIRAWNEGRPVGGNPLVRTAFSCDFGVLQKWAGSNAPVFFDLGETEQLLWLVRMGIKGFAYLHRLSREQFIEWHRSAVPHPLDEFVHLILPKLVAEYESSLQAQLSGWDPLRPRGFRRSVRL